jgi:Na+/proline symporter
VIAGLITGTVVTVFWERTPALNSLIYELVPAFGAGLLVTMVVSYMTRPPEDVDRMFETMKTDRADS